MYYNYDFITSIQQLYQYLEVQQRKIDHLELLIEDLKANIETMRKENSGKVERIEYKFDQLKVERLEGTLNIGITPTGGIEPTSIEDFTVSRNSVNLPATAQQNPFLFENVKNAVFQYLNNDCYDVMAAIEQQYNNHLETSYRNFIIDDVRKQIEPRIHYYLRGLNTVEADELGLKEIEQTTITKITNDINKTIEQFIKHLPQKGE
ncbi:spore gernimation protein [Anaerobacillus alkaliphilus]|uniref:Spore gernimation protein n=1 Tax=Anaerobacillus alkaliphilus TaxID=1548597 RepID=A0A4Q0VP47_9BACI|nr:spore germination protein GerPC [Anaerobacillus alkaliphilus]RXI98206.1 spore gernimation protein [Anaerobacillus alkaliphilus]